MKYWEIGEKNGFGIECYKLHLKLPYGDEKVIAAFVQDENNNNKYIRAIINSLNNYMRLQPGPSADIKNERKQMEYRLYDKKRKELLK